MRRIVLLGLLAGLLAGCIPSENRLYDKDDLVFEEALIGEYEEKAPEARPFMVVEKGKDTKSYLFGRKDADNLEPLHLLKLGNHFFLDNGTWFWKVDAINQEARVWIMSPDWIKGLVDKDPKAVAHELFKAKVIEDGVEKEKDRVKLTAPTKDLRAFVLKHIDTPAAWAGPFRYVAQQKKPLTESGLFSKKQQTFEAWWEFRQVMQSLKGELTATALAEGAETLAQLSGPGVDEDATSVAKDTAKKLEQIVEKARKGESTEAAVKALVKETAEPAKKAAAKLSERYALKFGSID